MSDELATDPRETKLPIWAQKELARLRRKVEDAERRATEARLSNGPEDSDTLLDPYDETPIRLPRGTKVRFVLGKSYDYVDVQILRRREEGPYVELMGQQQLVIRPQVSNVVRVQIDPR